MSAERSICTPERATSWSSLTESHKKLVFVRETTVVVGLSVSKNTANAVRP